MPLFPSYADFRRLEFKTDLLLKQLGVVVKHDEYLIHMEQNLMTTVKDIEDQSAALVTEVRAETNAVEAVKTAFAGLQSQVADLTQELKDALANGADPATLSAIADNLTAATQAVDANTIAEAALANTTQPAPPVVTPPDQAPVTPVSGAIPAIAQISPSAGMSAGGQAVTISGTNLGAVTSVTFGDVAAVGVVPDHDSSLQVTTPPGSGTVDVIVHTPSGDSNAVSFTYA